MLAQIDIDECTSEVSDIVSRFLKEEGGYDTGYYTYVSGTITLKESSPEELYWDTPIAKEELTEKGKRKRGQALRLEIAKAMDRWGVNSLELRTVDTGYGGMETHVIYVIETKRRVSLA